jgi:predicted ATPase with chaperone activity
MALTDRQRHDAYEALAEAFADRTDLVIEMLRSDHDHLATKDDLALLEARLTATFERQVHDAFGAQTRTMLISLISALVLIVATNALAVVAG